MIRNDNYEEVREVPTGYISKNEFLFRFGMASASWDYHVTKRRRVPVDLIKILDAPYTDKETGWRYEKGLYVEWANVSKLFFAFLSAPSQTIAKKRLISLNFNHKTFLMIDRNEGIWRLPVDQFIQLPLLSADSDIHEELEMVRSFHETDIVIREEDKREILEPVYSNEAVPVEGLDWNDSDSVKAEIGKVELKLKTAKADYEELRLAKMRNAVIDVSEIAKTLEAIGTTIRSTLTQSVSGLTASLLGDFISQVNRQDPKIGRQISGMIDPSSIEKMMKAQMEKSLSTLADLLESLNISDIVGDGVDQTPI